MNPSTTALTLNMQLPNIATVSWAVQGDQLARIITATLVDGSTPWTPEASYHGVVRYQKPDGTSGVYDVDEDGNPAVTWSGNVATVTIAHQALTCAGSVVMQLEFYDTNNARITAFGWCNNVQPSAVTDTEFLSTDYYNILSLQIAAVLEVTGEMTPYDNTPEMDGGGSPGSSLYYSRGNHVHPTDTSRASATDMETANTNITNLQGQICAFVETGDTSSRVYGAGGYVVWKGSLYRVIEYIASGAAFTVGTNIVSVTVANEIKQLSGSGSLNTNLFGDGTASYIRIGRLVIITITDLKVKSDATTGHNDNVFTGVPAIGSTQIFLIWSSSSTASTSLRVKVEGTSIKIHYATPAVNAQYYGTVAYFTTAI